MTACNITNRLGYSLVQLTVSSISNLDLGVRCLGGRERTWKTFVAVIGHNRKTV